jgi:hypothetical protein
MLHVPVPLVIVTRVPLTEQAPDAAMVGTIPEVEDAATVKVDWYRAVAGAPVKVTVCAALAALVDCVTGDAVR